MKALLCVIAILASSMISVPQQVSAKVMPAPALQEEGSIVSKTYCAQAFGYSDIDKLKADLLIGAKRLVVSELFGELIASSTAVKDFVVTSDQIRASSIGFVRVDGDVQYANGQNLGEVCATIKGYTTPQDREQFKPTKISKRNCVSDPKLTPRDLRTLAQEEVIVKALEEFEPKLVGLDRTKILRLLRRVQYPESGLVPDTDTFCARVEGEVTPIEVKALIELGSSDSQTQSESASSSAGAVSSSSSTLTSTQTTTGTGVLTAPAAGATQLLFGDKAKASSFNALWKWNAGPSPDSNYRISQNRDDLTIISGRNVDFYGNTYTAPSVSMGMTGTFEISTRLDFDPTDRYHAGGVVIRSTESPSTWIGLRRYSDGYGGQGIQILQTQNGNATEIAVLPYAKSTAYIRIGRDKELFDFAVSENGQNWLSLKASHLFSLPESVDVVLFIYSTSSNGILGKFSQVYTSSQLSQVNAVNAGEIPFELTDVPGVLASNWSYYPAGSKGNSYRIANQKITLIAGQGTETYGGNRTAPLLVLPESGSFSAQVQLDFDPRERFQVAGFGIHAGEEPGNFISVRRYSDGYGGQFIDVERVMLGGGAETIAKKDYSQKTVFFKIERNDPLLALYFSGDGKTWTSLAEEYVMSYEDPVWVTLYVWSNGSKGVQGTFSNMSVKAIKQ